MEWDLVNSAPHGSVRQQRGITEGTMRTLANQDRETRVLGCCVAGFCLLLANMPLFMKSANVLGMQSNCYYMLGVFSILPPDHTLPTVLTSWPALADPLKNNLYGLLFAAVSAAMTWFGTILRPLWFGALSALGFWLFIRLFTFNVHLTSHPEFLGEKLLLAICAMVCLLVVWKDLHVLYWTRTRIEDKETEV